MTYEALRHFADSWGLIFMGVLFLSFIGWTFRPDARRRHQDAAQMIFDEGRDRGDDHDR